MSPDQPVEMHLPTIDGNLVIFPDSGHRYTLGNPYRGVFDVRLETTDGVILGTDRFNLADARKRRQFHSSERIADGNGRADTVRRELIILQQLAGDLDVAPAAGAVDKQPYRIDETGIYFSRTVPGSPAPVESPLTNFGVWIRSDIRRDEGNGDIERVFGIELVQGTFRSTSEVKADEFFAWKFPIKEIGPGAITYPGQANRERAAVAVQSLSKWETCHEYAHTGWRRLADGSMGYLSLSGAIAADGLRPNVTVHLDAPLDGIDLPAPPAGEVLTSAVRTELEILSVADRVAGDILLAFQKRAVFGPSDSIPVLVGRTGTGKTMFASLLQQGYGASLEGDRLPGNFLSTGNALETITNLAKDTMLVVDDFQRDNAYNADKIAERIGRAVGNRSGRARLTQDARLRRGRTPRCSVLFTAEDMPRGAESLRARMLAIEMSPEGMNWDRLKVAQRHARDGVYAQAMAGFIQWVAQDYEGRKNAFREETEALLPTYREIAPHARTAMAAAELSAAGVLYLRFALECGAITEAEVDDLAASLDASLRHVVLSQQQHQAAADPVKQFMSLLDAAIISKKAAIATDRGEAPDPDGGAWGWEKVRTGDGESWRLRGDKIGWLARQGVYLNWTAAYQVVQRAAVAIGTPLPLTEAMLLKRLDERGLILARDEKRQTLKIRRRLEGRSQNVIHLQFPLDEDSDSGTPPSRPDKPDKPDNTAEEEEISSEYSEDSHSPTLSGLSVSPSPHPTNPTISPGSGSRKAA